MYDREYFEDGVRSGKSLYENYRWLPELTIPLAVEIATECSLRLGNYILDYGCAKGYLVKALRMIGRNAYGYDTSEYAIKNCDPDVRDFVSMELKVGAQYHCIIAKDVLEHLNDEQLDTFMKYAALHTKKLFVIVPLAQDGKYVVPSYELDVTHIQRRSFAWWCEFLEKYFPTVKSSYSCGRIKLQYVQKFPKGNGFFLCKC